MARVMQDIFVAVVLLCPIQPNYQKAVKNANSETIAAQGQRNALRVRVDIIARRPPEEIQLVHVMPVFFATYPRMFRILQTV